MSSRHRRMSHTVLVTFASCLVAAVIGPITAANAGIAHKYGGESFSIVGTPRGAAVDSDTGDVYVLNTSGQVQKFTSTGVPANFSALGSSILASSCGANCRQIAVDNSPGVNHGVIYLGSGSTSGGASGVKVYLPSGQQVGPVTILSIGSFGRHCGVAVDAVGDLFSSVSLFGEERAIDHYSVEGWASHPSQTSTIESAISPTDVANPCRMAVASDGVTYVISGVGPTVKSPLLRYEPSAYGPPGEGVPGAASTELDSAGDTYVAVDQSTNDVYADRGTQIARYGSDGSLIEAFGEAPQVNNSPAVAINEADKKVYVADSSTGKVAIYPKYISPDISGVIAVTGPGEVGFAGTVDPAGGGDVNSCMFQYREKGEPTFTDVPCTESTPFELSTDVSGSAAGLTEGVVYEYRLTAANVNVGASSPLQTFSVVPPTIEGAYSSDVKETEATLNAVVNPHNSPTEYFFEYGPTPEYGQTVPLPTGNIAGGVTTGQQLNERAMNLSGQVTYHFRVVAVSAVGRVESQDQTFNYFPQQCPNSVVRQQTGSDFLPDCRAYELVTPAKQGNALLNLGIFAPPPSYATAPARLAFGGVAGGVNGTEPVIGLGPDIYVSTRTPRGWVTTLPGLKGNEVNGTTGKTTTTADITLSRFLDFNNENIIGANPLDPEAEEDGFVDYRINRPYIWKADGTFIGRWPVVGAAIRYAEYVNGYFQPSPDFSHLIFTSSNVAFAPNGVIEGPGSAYDFDTDTGTTEIISKLPSGEDIPQQAAIGEYPVEDKRAAFEEEETIGIPGISNTNGQSPREPWVARTKNPARVNPGVSTDGSHILMSTSSEPYDDFTVFEDTSSYRGLPPIHIYMRVDGVITYDVSRGDRVQYIGMTADASKVYFRSAEQLTEDDHDESVDLYMWSEATDSLTRLSQGEGGAGDTDSCSATWIEHCDVTVPVYTGGSVPETALASESGAIYFYSPEQLDGAKGTAGARNLYLYADGHVTYVTAGAISRMNVTPDGAHMAMISSDRLAGYDNQGFAEMYTYDPASDDIVCVSCNPRGAAPVDDVEGSSFGLFLANDGRTFFYTQDALVPKDTNKLGDVYEYVEGRPQLITTGTGSHDKTFNQSGKVRSRAGLAAVSADGTNVYFDTYETLVPEDENGEFLKFYDARTGGGFPAEAPRQPCVAADECHNTTSAPPSPSGIVSNGGGTGSGNVKRARGARRQARLHRARHHRRRHPRGRKGRNTSRRNHGRAAHRKGVTGRRYGSAE